MPFHTCSQYDALSLAGYSFTAGAHADVELELDEPSAGRTYEISARLALTEGTWSRVLVTRMHDAEHGTGFSDDPALNARLESWLDALPFAELYEIQRELADAYVDHIADARADAKAGW